MPVQVKHGSFVGGLLVFLGLIGCLVNFIGGLVLIGLGLVVAALVGRGPGLMCPNCGAQAATLHDLAQNMMPPPPSGKVSQILDRVAVWMGAVVTVGAMGILIYVIVTSHHQKSEPTVAATAADSAQESGRIYVCGTADCRLDPDFQGPLQSRRWNSDNNG